MTPLSLSPSNIVKTYTMNNKFFKNLKACLKKAITYKKGKLVLQSKVIEIPEPSAQCKTKQIKKMRLSYFSRTAAILQIIELN